MQPSMPAILIRWVKRNLKYASDSGFVLCHMPLAVEILGQHHAPGRQQPRVPVARRDPHRAVEPHDELATRGAVPVGMLVHGMGLEELQAIDSDPCRDAEFDDPGRRWCDDPVESHLLEVTLSFVIDPDSQVIH